VGGNGTGVGYDVVQVVPFHWSMRGDDVGSFPPVYPTAVHQVPLTHETDSNGESTLSGGSGVATIDHAAPVHSSANVWISPPSVTWPTARQNDGPTHETEFNALENPDVGSLGLGVTVQVVGIPAAAGVLSAVRVSAAPDNVASATAARKQRRTAAVG
jgi:hypothetical protein